MLFIKFLLNTLKLNFPTGFEQMNHKYIVKKITHQKTYIGSVCFYISEKVSKRFVEVIIGDSERTRSNDNAQVT